MNEHELMNALGLRKDAGAISPVPEAAKPAGLIANIKDWFRKTYDPSYGLTGKKVYPTREDKMRYLQNQTDRGGRFKTAEGMNSQAIFAGSDSGSYGGSLDARDREFYYNRLDKAKNRAEAFRAMQKGFPEYRPDEIERGLANAEVQQKAAQMDLDRELETYANKGRKMFFDAGGRWAPAVPKKTTNCLGQSRAKLTHITLQPDDSMTS